MKSIKLLVVHTSFIYAICMYRHDAAPTELRGASVTVKNIDSTYINKYTQTRSRPPNHKMIENVVLLHF